MIYSLVSGLQIKLVYFLDLDRLVLAAFLRFDDFAGMNNMAKALITIKLMLDKINQLNIRLVFIILVEA